VVRETLIFVVDDERLIADTLGAILRIVGFTVECFYNAATALTRAMETPPTLLVSDIVMPGMDGFMLAERIKSICPKCRIVFVSGNACVVAANEPNSEVEVLAKPVPPTELIAKIRSMLASG
jgi:FixJ family two-component response regulator